MNLDHTACTLAVLDAFDTQFTEAHAALAILVAWARRPVAALCDALVVSHCRVTNGLAATLTLAVLVAFDTQSTDALVALAHSVS